MKTNNWFYGYCLLIVVGWIWVRTYHPNHLIAYSFASYAVAWALYRWPTRIKDETLASFFLYERKMPRREFVGTLVTTNIGFFSSVAFSCYLIATQGIGPAILLVIAWVVGLLWFARSVPSMFPFFREGSTIHEFIAVSYGKSDVQRRQLRFYSSTITFLLYLCSVGAEIKFTSDVFAGPTGLSTGWLAVLLSLAGVVYVSISGYRGVVSTDRLRFWAILLGVGALYYFIHVEFAMQALHFPAGYLGIKMMTIGNDPWQLFSLIVLLALYQFCVMDMWERCIAIAKSHDFGNGGVEEKAQVIGGIRRMIAWSIIPFIVLFGAWYGIGILAVGQHWVDDMNGIVPELISRLGAFASTGLKGAITESLVILCFTAAALSTIDGFIIAAVQTVICDWMPTLTSAKKEWNQLDDVAAHNWLIIARVLVVAVGAAAVGFAYMSFGILSFWVGMYSLMLSFFPAVFLRVVHSDFARSSTQIAVSIVSGASCALIAAILGTFVLPTVWWLNDLPPILAVGVAMLVLAPPRIKTFHLFLLLVGGLGIFFMWRYHP